MGITLNVNWAEPRDPDNSSDQAASDRNMDFMLGWFAHPIYRYTVIYTAVLQKCIWNRGGKYPPSMRERVDSKSAAQGFGQSRLPDFTPTQQEVVAGSSDFLGLNIYTGYLVQVSRILLPCSAG